jgi:trk system potassium uptake protein
MEYGQDPLVLAPITVAIVLGSLGFLVIVELYNRATGARGLLPKRRTEAMSVEQVRARGMELARRSRYRLGDLHPERFGFNNPIPLSLHTRLMLIGTAVLWVVGTVGFALFEWRNPATLGAMPWWERAMQSFFSGAITPRTAGFNTVDYAAVQAETRFLTDGLMFTGAGSGSTAGGVKVTTLAVLAVAVLAEVRGHKDTNVLDRRIPDTTVRVAIAVVLVSFATVMAGTMAMMSLSELDLDLAMFEVISALATVGLSANVTPTLGIPAQMLLAGLMLLGRVGPLTLASSLTLRTTPRSYRLPEGRPMIG